MQWSCVSGQWRMTQNWREIDLSVQNWHEVFDECWPEHSKISKNCPLMDCFWRKYIIFELKMYRGVMFGGTEYWCKIWRKTDLCFQKWHEEFSKFSPGTFENLKIRWLWCDPFIQSRKYMSLKFAWQLGVVTTNNDAKFEEELTFHDNEEWCRIWSGIDLSVQNWRKEFTNFDPSIGKSQKFALYWASFDQII